MESSALGAQKPWFRDPRQLRIYERLHARVGDGPAVFYREACQIRGDPKFVTASHQISHLLREVESSLRDVTLPDTYTQPEACSTCGSRPLGHKREIEAIAAAYGLDAPLTALWMRLAVRQNDERGLHHYAHRDSLELPRPLDAYLRQFYEDMDTLFDAVLDKLEIQTETVYRLLDTLLQREGSRRNAEALKSTVPHNLVTYRYFFERLDKPSWLLPLEKKGFFSFPSRAVYDSESGQPLFTGWPQSRYYLKRMAAIPSVQPDVLRIAVHLADTQNPYVRQDVVEIALQLPVAMAAQLAHELQGGAGEGGRFLPERSAELAAYLAQGGAREPSIALVDTLCATLLDGESSVESWHYEASLKHQWSLLVEYLGLAVVEVLCQHLHALLDLADEQGKKALDEPSPFWRPAIEEHEQNHAHGHFGRAAGAHYLTSLIRDGSELLLGSSQVSLEQLVVRLESRSNPLFQRLAFHLLRRFPTDARDLIIERLVNRACFDAVELRHEYALLAQEQFASLPLEAQTVILGWVEQGPDVEAYRERYEHWEGQPPSDEIVRAYGDHWRRDKLTMLGSAGLPPTWKQRLADLATAYGPAEHPDFPVYARFDSLLSWGPHSPKSPAELGAMPLESLIALLKTWQPSPPELFQYPIPSPEGLAENLAVAVEADQEHFAAAAGAFCGLEPVYVSGVLSGMERAVTQHKTILWKPVLDLCHWVIYQTRACSPGSHVRPKYDPRWSWSRSRIALLLSAGFEAGPAAITFELRQEVWHILSPLTKDPDPSAEEEQEASDPSRGPTFVAANSVRGLALRGVISYALWVRRALESKNTRAYGERWLPQMPEARLILEAHLDRTAETSQAIRSVYGQHLPNLVWLDRPWTRRHLPLIFPEDEAAHAYWQAAWEPFVVYSNPSASLLALLQAAYFHALAVAAAAPSTKDHPYNPDERLAEHLMLAYWHGPLTLEEPGGLLSQFFTLAPLALRRYALAFLGHTLYEEQATIPVEVLARLHLLWERRIEAVSRSSTPGALGGELAAFGWWFCSEKLEADWSLAQLEMTLSILNLQGSGSIEARHLMVGSLARLSATRPLLAVRCLALLVLDGQEHWQPAAEHQQMQAILLHARVADGEAWQKARELINRLASRGDVAFLGLLRQDSPG